jgi:hypothetical protein
VSNEPAAPAEPRPPAKRATPAKKNDRVFFVMLVIIALAAASWFLADKFVGMSQIQDCVMSGRKNCVQVDDPNPR